MKVLQFPLARVTVVFIVGIVFAYYTQPSPNLVFAFLFVATLALGGVYFWRTQKPHRLRYFDLTVYGLAFAIGVSTQTIHTASYQKNHYTQIQNVFEQPHIFTLVLNEKLKSSNSSQRYVALVRQIDKTQCSGKLLLNIRKDSLHHVFVIGNALSSFFFDRVIIMTPTILSKQPNHWMAFMCSPNKATARIMVNTGPIEPIIADCAAPKREILWAIKIVGRTVTSKPNAMP